MKVPLLSTESGLTDREIRSEKELHKFLFGLYESVKEHQKPLAQKWARYDRFYRGKQWERQLEPWRAQIVRNAVFQIIESQLPVLATSEIRLAVIPVEDGDRATADLLDATVRYLNWKYRWYKTTILATKTALKLGGCILKTGWDPKLGYSGGDVYYTYVLPYYFFPDPNACSLEEASFVIEAKLLPLAEIVYRHGEKARGLKPEKREEQAFLDLTERYVDPLGPARTDEAVTEGKTGMNEFIDRALYIEVWFNDYTTVREGKRERLLYPGGRHVVMTRDRILIDEPNPYWHRKFPYVLVADYPDDHSFWPIGEIELIMHLQKLINKTVSQIVDNITLHGNPIWVVDDQSGVDASSIDNAPNAVIRKRQGTEATRKDPPNLPPYVVQMPELAMRYIEDITGIHDIVQGRRPENVRSYSAMRLLAETAERRLQLKLVWQQDVIREASRQIVSNLLQFYTTERFRRICGDEMVDRAIQSRIAAGLNRRDGRPVKDRLVFSIDEAYESYDLATDAEAVTYNTRQMMRELARDLYAMQAIDREALLKILDLPGWQEIIERMEGRRPGQPAEKGGEEKEEEVPEAGVPYPEMAGMPPLGSEIGGGMEGA